MNSGFWSELTGTTTGNGSLLQPTKTARTTTLQDLLIKIACSHLSDMSINERIYPSIGSDLGTGATFSVERKEAKGRKLVAIKHIRKSSSSGRTSTYNTGTRHLLDAVLLEVQVLLHMGSLEHPNIVELLAFGWDEDALPYLVLEYADLGTLDGFLRSRVQPLEEKIRIAIDMSAALELLHECDIIHGDIKLENVLVFSSSNGGWNVKLADFGFCCSAPLGQRVFRGTATRNAPEIRNSTLASSIHDDPLNYQLADVYSYGLAFWEILNDGRRYYSIPEIDIRPGDGEVETARVFLSRLDSSGEEIIPYAVRFAESMKLQDCTMHRICSVFSMTLARNPADRYEIRDIRLELDPQNKSELEIAIPLGAPRYSIFDISTAPMPWEARKKLANNLRIQSEDPQNEYRGQDAFNLAALHALGYGVQLNESACFEYLQLASSYGYPPAVVLHQMFGISGLVKIQDDSNNWSTELPFPADLRTSLRQLPQELRFSNALRAYYKHRNTTLASGSITIRNEVLSSQDERTMLEYLHRQGHGHLHELMVEFHPEEKEPPKPLIHHLIVSHEALAELALRQGANGQFFTANNISLLNVACACGSTRIVRTLLELYPDIAQRTSKEGISPLHWLFMFEDSDILEVTEALVRNGASKERVGVMVFQDFNLVFSGPPLHWAIMARNLAAVQALTKFGADVQANTPMPAADCFEYPGYAVDLAVCLLLPEIVEFLVTQGAKTVERPDKSWNTSLHHIGDAIDPFRLWLYHGPNLETSVTRTIHVLLNNGAHIDDPSQDNNTPLHWMVARTTCITSVLEPFLEFHPECLDRVLLRAAAALQHDHINSEKIKILLNYCSRFQPDDDFTEDCIVALRRCTKDGTLGAAKCILSYISAPPSEIINGKELIHLAATHDHVELIELFLQLGGDINLDIDGTPAAAAATFGKRNALSFLLENGASVYSMPSKGSTVTLLHEIVANTLSREESEKTLALVSSERFISRFLPVVDHYDDRGLTALHEAIIWGNGSNVARLVEQLEAKPLSVRGTGISPTTLAALALDYTPWIILEQGEFGVQNHKQALKEILEYLVDSVKLEPPQTVDDHERVTRFWTRPSQSHWQPQDQLAEWYTRRTYSDRGYQV